ncbi:type II toxin-antitoxin system SpoIISA family toxin [Shouchella shacheensis]|uniref:type II toxin-antitoxin system SpoIISA family toxin n=1 Tax=Shouchella shacheensis TaxID=1649580 RepID=UPI00073FCCF8|nr:type II toxin-antitoxin system SpoIISA family toxin [Shouchella shacheensis]
MLLTFQVLVWVVLLALACFVFAYWKQEEMVRRKIRAIRKIWYTLFAAGAGLTWTVYPESLFERWHHYLIVAVLFVIVDAFVFLSAYVKRIGSDIFSVDTGHLLEQNNQLLDTHQDKLKAFYRLLKDDPINVYYGGHRAYITGVKEIITQFAEKTDTEARVFPFSSSEEKAQLVEHYDDRATMNTTLERQEIYYADNEKVAFIPIILAGERHVLKLTADERLTEFDTLLFASLVAIYDLLSVSGGEKEEEE